MSPGHRLFVPGLAGKAAFWRALTALGEGGVTISFLRTGRRTAQADNRTRTRSVEGEGSVAAEGVYRPKTPPKKPSVAAASGG